MLTTPCRHIVPPLSAAHNNDRDDMDNDEALTHGERTTRLPPDNNDNNVGDGQQGRTNSLQTMTTRPPPKLVYVHNVLDIFNIT